MKKVKIKEQLPAVQARTIEIEGWEASDGKIFKGWNGEKECASYEIELSMKPILETVEIRNTSFEDFPDFFPTTWYHIESIEQMKAIENHLGIDSQQYRRHYYTNHKAHFYEIGDWIGATIESGGDSPDDINIFTWNIVGGNLRKYLENFEKGEKID